MERVLVPVAVLEGEAVPAGLIELLGTMDVTVLGYQELPDQTPPDQARAQFEERATSALEDIAEEFRAAGGDADYRLVFTQERQKSIDRVTAEIGARAYAITGATGSVERLLVPLTGDVAVDRIVDFVADLVGDQPIGVTLFLVADDDAAGSRLAAAASTLSESGVSVTTKQVSGKPFDALIDAVPGHDAIVMGERAPSLSSLLFGNEPARVAAASVGPVFVVRRDEDSD